MVSTEAAKKKILGKGYSLLVLPLAVQFCLLFVLTGLLVQAEEEVQEQVRSKAIISQANALSKLFYDAGVAMGGYSITKSQLFSDRFDKIVRQIPIDEDELSSLIGDDQNKQVQVAHISEITSEGLKILGDAKVAIDDNRVDVAQFRARHMYKQIRQLSDQLQDELKSLTDDYRRIENSSPEQQSRNRTMVKVFLVGWVVFDVLLVIALFADFRQAVLRAVVGENSLDDTRPVSEGMDNPKEPGTRPGSKSKNAFGSKTWQAKRQRYGGKLAQASQSAQNSQNSRGPRPRT